MCRQGDLATFEEKVAESSVPANPSGRDQAAAFPGIFAGRRCQGPRQQRRELGNLGASSLCVQLVHQGGLIFPIGAEKTVRANGSGRCPVRDPLKVLGGICLGTHLTVLAERAGLEMQSSVQARCANLTTFHTLGENEAMTESDLPDALATLPTKETAGMGSGTPGNNVSGAQGPGMRGCLHGERQTCGTLRHFRPRFRTEVFQSWTRKYELYRLKKQRA